MTLGTVLVTLFGLIEEAGHWATGAAWPNIWLYRASVAAYRSSFSAVSSPLNGA